MNGFHDSANSIATVVSTRVLRPQWAVAWAAFFNVAAYFIFELKVASTIGKGTIDPAIVDHAIVFGALVGAISWNVHHLVVWDSVELVARADRRPGRRGACEERHRARWWPADSPRRSRSSSFRRRSASCSGRC